MTMGSVDRARFRIKKLYVDLVRGRDRLVITPATHAPSAEPPIFVFGLYRSGTTLVRYILDAHSRIAAPPESDFLAHLDAIVQDDRSIRGLGGLGFDEQHVVPRLRVFAEYFFANYAAAKGKARWADKTPRYVDHMSFIHSVFPNAQFVMVYRHPLDQIHSFTRGGTHVPWGLEPYVAAGEDPRIAGARYWSDKTQALVEFQSLHTERCFPLFYENLSTDPEAVTPRLFHFLDEAWEPAVLDLPAHQHDLGMGDSKIFTAKRIAHATGGYRTWADSIAEQVLEITRPVMRELAYEDIPGATLADG